MGSRDVAVVGRARHLVAAFFVVFGAPIGGEAAVGLLEAGQTAYGLAVLGGMVAVGLGIARSLRVYS